MRRVTQLFRLALSAGLLGLFLCFATIIGSAIHFSGARAKTPPEADVIIVLSAGLDQDSGPDVLTRARVEEGVALWRAGAAPEILMSGGYIAHLDQHMAHAMKAYAVEIGAPEAQVQVEGVSISTFENARFTLDVAGAERWRRAVIVTDDFHLLRAWGLFEFWRSAEDVAIVGLRASDGRAQLPWPRQLRILGRETLAYPFNMLKIIGQVGLDLLGEGDDRMIR